MSNKITRGQIFKYAVMPEILPRLRDLFMSGFQFVPYFIAMVYRSVGLLGTGHPYLNNQNIGRFGLRHVIAEAANNLVISRKNIDQIILFFSILVGLAIIAIQIVLLMAMLFVQPVLAAMPGNFSGFFVTPEPAQDLAFILLDLTFGIPGMFGSCVDPGIGGCTDMSGNAMGYTDAAGQEQDWILAGLGWPHPVHAGLHQLFQIYSIGLLVVAVMITGYFVITIVAETAQTGTPFGKRFNKVWAPIRLVVAFGLLVPISYGLNSSQYIVLHAAKYGSSFATNGWALFNNTLTGNYLGDTQKLLSQPNVPEIGGLLQFVYVARTCAELEKNKNGRNIRPFLVKDPLAVPNNMAADPASYEDMIEFAEGDTQVILRYGIEDKEAYPSYKGFVAPICGEITLTLTDPRPPGEAERGPEILQRYYWFILYELWTGVFQGSPPQGYAISDYTENYPFNTAVRYTTWHPDPDVDYSDAELPPPEYKADLQDFYREDLDAVLTDPSKAGLSGVLGSGGSQSSNVSNFVQNNPDLSEALENADLSAGSTDSSTWDSISNAINNLFDNPGSLFSDFFDIAGGNLGGSGGLGLFGVDTGISGEGALGEQAAEGRWNEGFAETPPGVSPYGTPVALSKGWAGAGIWYNRVAELNGSVTTAVFNVPIPSRYPEVLEYVHEKKRQQDQNITPAERYKPELANGDDINFPRPEDGLMANAMYESFQYWQADGHVTTTHTAPTGNIFVDTVKSFFGVEGLYSMRRNPDVHPLAQLVGVGKSLIEAGIRNIGYASMGGIGGAIGSIFEGWIGSFASHAIGFIMSITIILLTVGFVLFYVVPFLPFIYFFFAVGGWIKGIFEAMIGAPLWALSHLRIDGEGLPGQAAINGYYLIFEIFLRPILIVFGLLASISIFAAMVSVLNETWDLVTANLTGFDVRSETLTETGESISLPFDDTPQDTGSLIEYLRDPVDQFFFTVVYAIFVYLIGMSSFKMIDLVPNNILRWMGQSVATFNDSREDAAKSLVSTATIGGQQTIQAVGGGLQQALQSTATIGGQKGG